MNWSRQFWGFAVAPLAVPLSLVLMRLLKGQSIGLGYPSDAFEGDVIFFGFVAYLVIGCLVIPSMLVLRRLEWANPWSCSFTGWVAWFILTFLMPPHYDLPIPDPERLTLAIFLSIGGAVSSLVFWLIANGRPGASGIAGIPIVGTRLK